MIRIESIEQLEKICQQILQECKENVCLLLSGDLGAGKTTFTKHLLKCMGVKEVVNSPTFVILNQYQAHDLLINHMDAYRLENNEEVELYTENFYGAFNIIEWSENLNFDYEKDFKVIKITIKLIDEQIREFEIEGI
ncbi:tRNA threonylcarbamoyladenosine biosynthesis protein TsaE [Spiroplasma chinense]|uniref:tRNA threonylcarbamoyladenosine biosynthesis protein TsaE n=1 Tax=Spiroplasma chinense TaxID=216932 RepID=A0A5B9Y3W7_9MOLU|nr:tRNA (adenosine(37)-N6)-threonylcarbamoyltransferase complex ATPase subunit type 1 TsaE [Spiroplasma chinense]QEH61495.1 tRNA threonylcarbamoyladenosine biosynthesis protein TsaE [Spiroplasma chinense]